MSLRIDLNAIVRKISENSRQIQICHKYGTDDGSKEAWEADNKRLRVKLQEIKQDIITEDAMSKA